MDPIRILPAELPRRILMTADAVGGVWSYALSLARGLTRVGIPVELAVLGPEPSAAQRRDAEAIAGLRLHVAPSKLEWMADPWEDVERSRRWLVELAERTAVDLVHLNGYAYATARWPRRLPVLVVAHSCVCSWWRAVKGGNAPEAWDPYRREVAAGLRAADSVVAPTRAMLAALREHYGELPRAQVIANAVDPADHPPRAQADKRTEVLSAGRLWDKAKNLAALDRAAAQVRCPVLVAGDEAHPEGGRVPMAHARPLGRLATEAMAAAYAQAAIYCLPARYEPFGLSALEAALAGCALVLGDIPSLRELWHGAALFVAPDDDEGLADALNRLADDACERERLAAAARARALGFSPSRQIDAYLDRYAAIAGRGATFRSTACVS